MSSGGAEKWKKEDSSTTLRMTEARNRFFTAFRDSEDEKKKIFRFALGHDRGEKIEVKILRAKALRMTEREKRKEKKRFFVVSLLRMTITRHLIRRQNFTAFLAKCDCRKKLVSLCSTWHSKSF